jgi:hypothetical protein
MARPKPAHLLTVASEREAQRVEVAAGWAAVLRAANERPPAGREADALLLHAALQHVSTRTDVHLPATFSLRQRVIFDNLKNAVLAGWYRLGQCIVCRRWFLAHDQRQRVCALAGCARTVNQLRAKRNRAIEGERQRRARVRLKVQKRTK